MALTDDERARLLAFINEKWKSSDCGQCGENKWIVHGHAWLALADKPRAEFGGNGLPTAAVICLNCGNTVLVNMVIAGLVPSR